MSEVILHTERLRLERGGRQVFSGLQDLHVEAGRNLLVLGPSGCGKTSLLHVLTGLLPPQEGEVLFRGRSYRGLSGSQMNALRAQSFGVVLQKLHLLGHLSAFQNVALAFSASRRRPDHAKIFSVLESLSLKDKAHVKARLLSQGEAQRVAIARAVVHGPEIVFADEPTSALDDRNTETVCRLLCDLSKQAGASLIVSTHDRRVRELIGGDLLEMAA
jgi:ABC-type lipoprotein export system ATPase subunit